MLIKFFYMSVSLAFFTQVTVVAAVDMMIVVATVAEEEVATIATKSAHTYLGRLFNLRC